MRLTLVALLAGATLIGGTAVVATSTDAEARERSRVRTVVITPNYLSAGTQVHPFEQRAGVPNADARFRSTGFDLPGPGPGLWVDRWYLPRPHTGFEFDWALGRKAPGEQ